MSFPPSIKLVGPPTAFDPNKVAADLLADVFWDCNQGEGGEIAKEARKLFENPPDGGPPISQRVSPQPYCWQLEAIMLMRDNPCDQRYVASLYPLANAILNAAPNSYASGGAAQLLSEHAQASAGPARACSSSAKPAGDSHRPQNEPSPPETPVNLAPAPVPAPHEAPSPALPVLGYVSPYRLGVASAPPAPEDDAGASGGLPDR